MGAVDDGKTDDCFAVDNRAAIGVSTPTIKIKKDNKCTQTKFVHECFKNMFNCRFLKAVPGQGHLRLLQSEEAQIFCVAPKQNVAIN